MDKEQVLIVGGTGFIGYHLAKKLIKEGLTVTSISTKPPKRLRYLSNVRYLICDISNKNSLKKKLINIINI
jgi:nucleoside-diphosphate-sugar epimerase